MGLLGHQETAVGEWERLVHGEQRQIADRTEPSAAVPAEQRQGAILDEFQAVGLTKTADRLERLRESEVVSHVQRRDRVVEAAFQIREVDTQLLVKSVVPQPVAGSE